MINSNNLPSLRSRLMKGLFIPLSISWIIGTVIVILISSYFTEQAYDRALLDDAYSVASHVVFNSSKSNGQLELNLSSNEMSTLLFDESEIVFFQVLNNDEKLIAGHTNLNAPLPKYFEKPLFSDLTLKGRNFRAVSIHKELPANYYIVMAQTSDFRESLIQRLVLFSIIPQIIILMLLALSLRKVISHELGSLIDLEKILEKKEALDLNPIELDKRTKDVLNLGIAINGLFARIQDGIRMMREFSGNVAHELRTPLAGIRAQAEYGLLSNDPQIWKSELQGIVKSEARASHLVDQILALSLANEAQVSFKLEIVNVEEVIKDSILKFLPKADSQQVDLGAQGLESDLHILAQRDLLEGVMNNLIDNALRYGKNSHGDSRITIEVQKIQSANNIENIEIAVIDNGPGINNDQKELVKKRRTQGQAGQLLGLGAGLGLAIVNEYTRIMGTELKLAYADETAESGLKASILFLSIKRS
jgi:two-component system, OmpR family, sensor histidine kinase TctE